MLLSPFIKDCSHNSFHFLYGILMLLAYLVHIPDTCTMNIYIALFSKLYANCVLGFRIFEQ